MKNTVTLLFSLLCFSGFAQETTNFSEDKNMVKWNVLGLTSSTISLQYERLIAPKTSIATNINIMPKRSIPFFGTVEDIVKDKGAIDILKDVKMNAFSFTPEVRFYLGKEGMRGFYIAPFLRYDRFSIELPVEYIYKEQLESVTINGNVGGFSGGLSFGAQWRLASQWYLDVTFVGLSYGFASGELTGRRSLDAEEQAEVRKAMNDVELPVVKYTYEVKDDGVDVEIKGPWANVKLALAVGYRF